MEPAKRAESDIVYPGPRPFLTSEAGVFKGRSRETADLRDLLFSYRTVLLYAQSGTGKSSLIQAGLIPLLDGPYLIARPGGDVPPHVDPTTIENIFTFNVLSCVPELNAASLGNQSLLGSMPGASAASTPFYLILDQFEEIFTSYPEKWEERRPFFGQIRQLLAARQDVHLLLSMREEHIAALDHYSDLLPDQLRIRYHLERLREDAAIEAIVEPARQNGLRAIEEHAPSIVASLREMPIETRAGTIKIRGEFIEPLHLQVVCSSLWRRLSDNKPISQPEFVSLMDADRALANYYEQAVHAAAFAGGVGPGRLREWCESALITPAGTRGIVYLDSATRFRHAVEVLEEQHVVRKELRAGATWLELTHDRFIGPIRESNREWRKRRLRRRVVLIGIAATVLIATLFILYDREIQMQQELAKQNDRQEVAKQIQDYKSKTIDIVAAPALNAGGSESERAQATIMSAIAIWQLEDKDKAEQLFDLARKLDAWAAVQAIDRLKTTNASTINPDAVRAARIQFLKGIGPYLKNSPSLKEYVCKHGYYVIGASDRLADAPGELKRWQSTFPNAELGDPSGGWVPIIVDSFLTCDEAANALMKVEKTIKNTNPFVNMWYSGCTRCADLPWTVAGPKVKLPE